MSPIEGTWSRFSGVSDSKILWPSMPTGLPPCSPIPPRPISAPPMIDCCSAGLSAPPHPTWFTACCAQPMMTTAPLVYWLRWMAGIGSPGDDPKCRTDSIDWKPPSPQNLRCLPRLVRARSLRTDDARLPRKGIVCVSLANRGSRSRSTTRCVRWFATVDVTLVHRVHTTNRSPRHLHLGSTTPNHGGVCIVPIAARSSLSYPMTARCSPSGLWHWTTVSMHMRTRSRRSVRS